MGLCVNFFIGTITCVCEKKSCAIIGVEQMGSVSAPERRSWPKVPQLGVGSAP